MIRKTSIDAYKKINDLGLLSKRRLQVYNVLYNHGPLTGNEVLKHLIKEYGVSLGNAPSIISRLGELRKMEVVNELGKRTCSISKMNVILWDVTDSLPVKFDKPVKIKCSYCNGKGHFIEQQKNLF